MSKHFPSLRAFPPAAAHSREADLIKLNDDYFIDRWKFVNQAHRDYFLRYSNLAAFVPRTIVDGKFEKMIWACRIYTLLFLIDDDLDTGVLNDSTSKYNIIGGIMKVIERSKKPDPNSHHELVLDDILSAIEMGCTKEEFAQYVRLIRGYFESHSLSFDSQSLDEWIEYRIRDCAGDFVFATTRYAIECRLTDEALGHPLVAECERLACSIAGITNDICSINKEKLTNSAETNIITKLQHFGIANSEEEAIARACGMVAQWEKQLFNCCNEALSHSDFFNNTEMTRWIKALPYIVGGNTWWSQYCGRYNLPGISAHRMVVHVEGRGDLIEPEPYKDLEVVTIDRFIPIIAERTQAKTQ